ncbi:MAG: type III-B CRISPR module-associated protein Cmr3 [Mariprofundaceae bacterium]|nr:type III-B CRISPR module-associated protein Cmr3 [Mariprofundaceae bacterium]
MTQSLFLEAVDVLYLRGNKLFGAEGDDALAQMPPWPSVAAGAIRSRMLVDAKVCLTDFSKGNAKLSKALHQALGTPSDVGDFRVSHFGLAKKMGKKLEVLFPLPADLVVLEVEKEKTLCVKQLEPQSLPKGIMADPKTSQMPVLRTSKQAKAKHGYWLNEKGIIAYLQGKNIEVKRLLPVSKLWKIDPRLGIALNKDTATAQDGQIYTTDAVDLAQDIGFLTIVEGADGLLPKDGLLRFGGDGRAVTVAADKTQWPYPNWKEVEKNKRFKLVLRSPAIFPDGWVLPNMKGDRWSCGNGSARLVSAMVSRPDIISGWDIAKHAPKTAKCVVPTGSVYWLDDWQGDISDLKKVVREGLPCDDKSRRTEGFNHCMIAAWPMKGNKNV